AGGPRGSGGSGGSSRSVGLIAASVPFVVAIALGAQQASSTSPEFFESKVRPVLAANCYDCHADEQYGGLRLDTREAMLKGGKSGPAIVPGDPEKSLLIAAVRQTSDKLKMPKGGRLKPDEIESLVDWIRGGAVWPTAAASAAATSVPAPTASGPTYVIKPEQRAFWSFQPI